MCGLYTRDVILITSKYRKKGIKRRIATSVSLRAKALCWKKISTPKTPINMQQRRMEIQVPESYSLPLSCHHQPRTCLDPVMEEVKIPFAPKLAGTGN